MPENYGFTPLTAHPGQKQLIARHTPLTTRPLLLTGGLVYTRGCVVFAASPAGPFIKATTAAMPNAATDVIAIVSQDLDATLLGNTLHVGYVGPGEFIKETVLAASAALDAPSALLIEEALLTRGMNLVHMAYADVTDAV
jgi:hypothetical protein